MRLVPAGSRRRCDGGGPGVVCYALMVEGESKRAEEVPDGTQAMPPDGPAFHTAMAHLYRAEMHRMTVWRQRLDVTTNWAFLLSMGLTTFALGSQQVPHYIMLLGLAAVAISILIEGRRYRHLHHSRSRIQFLERNYFRSLLQNTGDAQGADWKRVLACDLERPRLSVGLITACRLRLRRNYLLLIYFITAVSLTKLFVHPSTPRTVSEFHARFAVGGLFPPAFVVITASLFIATATWLAFACPAGGDPEDGFGDPCDEGTPAPKGRRGRRPSRRTGEQAE